MTSNTINYHFPSHVINRPRLFLYSLGLFLVSFRKLIFGSIVLLIALLVNNYLYFISINKSQNYASLNNAFTISQINILFLALFYFIWKIKLFANGVVSGKWAFIKLLIKKFIGLNVSIIGFIILLFLSVRLFLVPFMFLLPAMMISLVLLIIGNKNFITNFIQAIRLSFGNWFYIIISIALFMGLIYLFVYNSFLNNLSVNIWDKILLLKISIAIFIVPYFAAFLLMLVNNLSIKKNIPIITNK